jgi:hypothetical protein
MWFLLQGEGGDQFLLATTYLQPEPAAADLQPDGARIAAAHCFARQQDARFPQDLAQGEVVAFADVEDGFGVHDGGSSGRVRYQPAARCALAADLFQQFGNAGIGEHVRVGPATRRIDARIGKHVVQQSAHGRFGVVDREPDATSQSVGRQHLARHAADLAIRHAHNYLFHLPSFFPGLR